MVAAFPGRFPEARPLHERVLALGCCADSTEHLEVAMELEALATRLQEEGLLMQARRLFEHCLEIREIQLGPVHADVAVSLNNLALLLDYQMDFKEAQSLYERALGEGSCVGLSTY